MLQRFASTRLILSALVLASSSAVMFAANPVLNKHVPEIVTNGRAKLVAPMATSEKIELAIVLPLHNQAGLDALLADLYNPASPNFHQWLTSEEFDLRFGPTRVETAALAAWARSQGLTIVGGSSNGRLINVEAPVDTINKAFHITEQTYHDPVLNRDFHAPDREPTTDLPFALWSIDGLDNATPPVKHYYKDPSAGIPTYISASGMGKTSLKGPSGPVTRTGSGPANQFLASDMRAAYYGSGNLDGTGQYVGVFSYDGVTLTDIPLFYKNVGLPNSTVPITVVGTNTCTSPCDDGEQILDILQVQGMAPKLSGISFYVNTSSAQTNLSNMVANSNIKVFTSSWGGGNFGTASDTYFQQMATQGQTYFNATGDDGAFNSATFDAPSLDPYIIQVGGTHLNTSGPGGTWVSEVGWPDSGGGYWKSGIATASKYTIPTWQSQTGVITSSNAGSTTYRNAPDMAAEADFDNVLEDEGSFLSGYGGTSFATPRMAAYVALANQQNVQNGKTAGLGFIDPTLYTAGLSSSTATVWHDITSGTNTASSGAGAYTAVAGYDLVTGWGSPNGTGLINTLAGAPPADFSLSPAASVSTVKIGSATSDSVTINAVNGFTGTVTLTGGTLPTGVTATYTSGTPTSPGSVSFTAGATATPGTYSFTLTGTSGSLSHTALISISVEKRTNGDFTISATSASVNEGATGTSTISLTATSGLAGGLTISVGSLPSGVTASLSKTSTPPDVYTAQTDTLTFTVAGSATAGSFSVVVTGTAVNGITHSVTVPLTVTVPPSLLVNGDFETGALTPWATTTTCSYAPELLTASSGLPPESGNYFALMAGTEEACTQTLTQSVTIPAGGTTATVGFWVFMLTNETGTTAIDTLTPAIVDGSGTTHNQAVISNATTADGSYWTYVSFDATPYIGQTVTLKFTAYEKGTTLTDFLLDNVTLIEK